MNIPIFKEVLRGAQSNHSCSSMNNGNYFFKYSLLQYKDFLITAHALST